MGGGRVLCVFLVKGNGVGVKFDWLFQCLICATFSKCLTTDRLWLLNLARNGPEFPKKIIDSRKVLLLIWYNFMMGTIYALMKGTTNDCLVIHVNNILNNGRSVNLIGIISDILLFYFILWLVSWYPWSMRSSLCKDIFFNL